MLKRIDIKSGINRDQTTYAGRGGYYACDKIRFRSSYPEKMGGWGKLIPQPLLGICRSAFTFTSLQTLGSPFVGTLFGTSKAVYILIETIKINITPIAVSINIGVDPVSVTQGSRVVSIRVLAHGAKVGSFIGFNGLTGVANIKSSELNTDFVVDTVIDNNNLTVIIDNEADITTTGGGSNGVYARYITAGAPFSDFGYGWGAGGWGVPAAWGLGSSIPVGETARNWFFSVYDNKILANLRYGALYFSTIVGINVKNLELISNARVSPAPSNVPLFVGVSFMSRLDGHFIALGCNNITAPGVQAVYDPLLIRWSDQGNIYNWTPSATNSSGFFRLSGGGAIVGYISTRQEHLIYTESSIYSMQFTGTSEVYSFKVLAESISIASPRAMVSANNLIYWMGVDKFYVYSGRIETLGCTLRNHVFNDFNLDVIDGVVAGTNEQWNEVWWFYPSKNSNFNDRYVIYNYLENIWYYGTMDRQAWVDDASLDYPLGVDSDGYIYKHEFGVDDDTRPMISFIETNEFDISADGGDGQKFVLLKRIVPDINFDTSNVLAPSVEFKVTPKNFSGSSPNTPRNANVIVTSTLDKYTNQIFLRTRSRQIALRISSNTLGTSWQLGACRFDFKPSGRR